MEGNTSGNEKEMEVIKRKIYVMLKGEFINCSKFLQQFGMFQRKILHALRMKSF